MHVADDVERPGFGPAIRPQRHAPYLGARDPILMAEAMRLGVDAGRKAFLAGRIQAKLHAAASSPIEGRIR